MMILTATRGRRRFVFRACDPDSRYARILRHDGWTVGVHGDAERPVAGVSTPDGREVSS